MKKIVLALLLVIIAVSAQAREITAGTVKLTGATNASFFNTTLDVDGNEETDTDTLNLQTSAVYFLTNNIGVGATVAYEDEETDFAGGGSQETTTTIVGPTVAFDLPLSEGLNFIADATVGYFKMEFDDGVDEADIDGLAYGLSAGVAMFPAKQVSLNLTADYQVLDGEDSVSDVDVESTSLGVNLGVSVYFD